MAGINKLPDETLEKYIALIEKLGMTDASKKLGIKRETLRRYNREYKSRKAETEKPFDDKIIKQLRERFSPDELRRLLSSSHFTNKGTRVNHSFDGKHIRIGYFTDPHLGSIYTDPSLIYQMFDMFKKEKIDFIALTGDIFEGLSHRAGHCYECSHLGYSKQISHGREVFAQWTDTPIYAIDGNHDRWYIKSNGAFIGEELARDLENFTFLGHDEGDIDLGSVTIKLWHGEDGSSYAYSYRVQKIIESLTGGEKPNVLLCGHTHKAFYVYDRHVHCVSGGAMQRQSKWMRAKRAQSHLGFWIIDMVINSEGVARFKPEFFALYE
jgi:predicted phosphodiesterase